MLRSDLVVLQHLGFQEGHFQDLFCLFVQGKVAHVQLGIGAVAPLDRFFDRLLELVGVDVE